MTTNTKANITISGTYPNFTYTFDGDDIDVDSGDINYGDVSGDVKITFKLKTSGFSFYFPADGNAPLSIDGIPANDLTSSDEFSGYEKSDSKNLKLKDKNSDGRQHEYALQFTDGTNHWPLDPKIINRSVSM